MRMQAPTITAKIITIMYPLFPPTLPTPQLKNKKKATPIHLEIAPLKRLFSSLATLFTPFLAGSFEHYTTIIIATK